VPTVRGDGGASFLTNPSELEGKLMELIIGWILFGVAAGSVAKGKNRSVPLWVIIGLLIGPFAVLIVGMMKSAPVMDQAGEPGRFPE
jgi:hypothetical protein